MMPGQTRRKRSGKRLEYSKTRDHHDLVVKTHKPLVLGAGPCTRYGSCLMTVALNGAANIFSRGA